MVNAGKVYVDLEEEVMELKSGSDVVQPALGLVRQVSHHGRTIDLEVRGAILEKALVAVEHAASLGSLAKYPSNAGVPSKEVLMESVQRMRQIAKLICKGVMGLKRELALMAA